jgi:hypothetical protein
MEKWHAEIGTARNWVSAPTLKDIVDFVSDNYLEVGEDLPVVHSLGYGAAGESNMPEALLVTLLQEELIHIESLKNGISDKRIAEILGGEE